MLFCVILSHLSQRINEGLKIKILNINLVLNLKFKY